MNNYLNNTLTNLHLQDFLKEKGLDHFLSEKR